MRAAGAQLCGAEAGGGVGLEDGIERRALPQSHDAGSMFQAAVWSLPFVCNDHESVATIGSDELQRFVIFFVFVTLFSVKILKDFTMRETGAVRACVVASQLGDAAGFYLASGFGEISVSSIVTRRATRASALSHLSACSAESAATANSMSGHTESSNNRFNQGDEETVAVECAREQSKRAFGGQ